MNEPVMTATIDNVPTTPHGDDRVTVVTYWSRARDPRDSDVIGEQLDLVGFAVFGDALPTWEPDPNDSTNLVVDFVGTPRPLSASDLRIPFAEIRKRCQVAVDRAAAKVDDGAPIPDQQLSVWHAWKRRNLDGVPTVRGWPPDHLLDVARIYTKAPHHPRQAVKDAFKTSPATASDWIRKCRDAGLLPQTTPGRAAAGVAS